MLFFLIIKFFAIICKFIVAGSEGEIKVSQEIWLKIAFFKEKKICNLSKNSFFSGKPMLKIKKNPGPDLPVISTLHHSINIENMNHNIWLQV